MVPLRIRHPGDLALSSRFAGNTHFFLKFVFLMMLALGNSANSTSSLTTLNFLAIPSKYS